MQYFVAMYVLRSYVRMYYVQPYLSLFREEFIMYFVTKATPIGNIDGRFSARYLKSVGIQYAYAVYLHKSDFKKIGLRV